MSAGSHWCHLGLVLATSSREWGHHIEVWWIWHPYISFLLHTELACCNHPRKCHDNGMTKLAWLRHPRSIAISLAVMHSCQRVLSIMLLHGMYLLSGSSIRSRRVSSTHPSVFWHSTGNASAMNLEMDRTSSCVNVSFVCMGYASKWMTKGRTWDPQVASDSKKFKNMSSM
jgi:hypothetical protein